MAFKLQHNVQSGLNSRRLPD